MAEPTKPEEKQVLWPWQEPGELKPAQAMPVIENIKNVASQALDNVKNGRWPWETIVGKEKPRVEAPRALPEPSRVTPRDDFINKLVGVESGYNPDAKNPNSSATGLGQFTAGTWRDAVKAAGKDYTLADRKDPEKSMEILRHFTGENEKRAVQDLGRQPTATELYMYHFLGRDAAGEFLKAKPEALATDYVSGAAARSNKNIFYTKGKPNTVAAVMGKFKGKFE